MKDVFQTEKNQKKFRQRAKKLKTKSGFFQTPFFMPIATYGTVKSLETSDVKELGFEIILSNTYHLWLRPGEKIIKKAGGLHNFMNWKGGILTDSGGFQIFSLGAKAKEKFGFSGVKLFDTGVEFTDPFDGQKRFLTPEKAIDIQLDLGSDIIMCLDVCPPYPCSFKEAQEAVRITFEWAQRSKKHFLKKVNEKRKKPLLFGIIQGSVFEDLRKQSALEISSLNFDGYAIGGVAVGEPREKMKEILKWTLPFLPENKPRYLMGLGKPEEIVFAIKEGIDMFDCVIPTREGRHGRVFMWKNKKSFQINFWKRKNEIKNNFYKTINIRNRKFKKDFSPLSKSCSCRVCQQYSRAYINHLFSIKESLAFKLVTFHNLFFYRQLIEKMNLK